MSRSVSPTSPSTVSTLRSRPGFFSEAAFGTADKGRFVAVGEWAGITITVVFKPLGAGAIR
jgi:hypothetical protein